MEALDWVACTRLTPCLTADKSGFVPGARHKTILADDAQGAPSPQALGAGKDSLGPFGSLYKTYVIQ
jgi:hypothetical protein